MNTDMTPIYGRAQGHDRVKDNAPVNTGKRTTIVSAIRLNGETVYTTFQGSLNGEIFKKYLTQELAPWLHPGDIVVMDNAKPHKVEGVKDIITGVSAIVSYLPPYSPDLNPIENMWSKIKSILRKAKARTQQEVETAIPFAFSFVTADDARGWFSHANYSLKAVGKK